MGKQNSEIFHVLDKGFVKLIDHLGSDLHVVNAARISFANIKEVFDKKDEKLIEYLAAHHHSSPFRHVQVTLHIKMPIFVKNQLWKHLIGAEYTVQNVKDAPWNECSRRYVSSNIEFHIPKVWRKQSKNNKQCSTDEIVENSDYINGEYLKSVELAYKTYLKMIESGVAREQAREVLPFSLYTEVYITGSLQMFANLVQLRDHPGAQKEIQDYARAISLACEKIAPVSWKALMKDRTPKVEVSPDLWTKIRAKFRDWTGY